MIYGMIPAREGSTRFPGKVFARLQGIPLVLYTYYNVAKHSEFQKVYIVTDSLSIVELANRYSVPYILTKEVNSGTERCAEATKFLNLSQDDVVVNIQADEPFINSDDVTKLLSVYKSGDSSVATLATRMNKEFAKNKNNVKIALTEDHQAVYFSRAMIPYNANQFYHHIGVYVYSKQTLDMYQKMGETQLEKAENLEQLRFLALDYNISVEVIDKDCPSVNTKKDLKLIRKKTKNDINHKAQEVFHGKKSLGY